MITRSRISTRSSARLICKKGKENQETEHQDSGCEKEFHKPQNTSEPTYCSAQQIPGKNTSETTTHATSWSKERDLPVHFLEKTAGSNSSTSIVSSTSISSPGKKEGRTTTSKRGGRCSPRIGESPRASSKKSEDQRKSSAGSEPIQILQDHIKNTSNKNKVPCETSSSSSMTTPSTAAANAAAAAMGYYNNHAEDEAFRAACHHARDARNCGEVYDPNKRATEKHRLREYDDGNREKTSNLQQNVFRRQRKESVPVPAMSSNSVTIEEKQMTTSIKNGIRRPNSPFGSTVRVMGSATAFHISRSKNCSEKFSYPMRTNIFKRPSNIQSSNAQSQTPSSVFQEQTMQPSANDNIEEPSARDLLLSLKSGSKSFELKSPSCSPASSLKSSHVERQNFEVSIAPVDDNGKRATVPLSPEAPPRIQHAHHQRSKSESLFFDPKTPKTPLRMDFPKSGQNLVGTPSFSLFDQTSFDSFGDADHYLRSPHGADPSLHGTFSLNASGDESSPRKSSLVSSPGHISRLSFSPGLRNPKSDIRDVIVDSSPPIVLDNVVINKVIDEVSNVPLLPKADSPPRRHLVNKNTMILKPSNKVRNKIPTPEYSKQQGSLKNISRVELEHERQDISTSQSRGFAPAFRHPIHRRAPTTTSMRRAYPAGQNNHSPVYHNNVEPPQGRRINRQGPMCGSRSGPGPSKDTRNTMPPNVFSSSPPTPKASKYEKKPTSLVDVDAHTICARLLDHKNAFMKCQFLLPGFRDALASAEAIARDELRKPIEIEIEIETTIANNSHAIVSNVAMTATNLAAKKAAIIIEREKAKKSLIIAQRRIQSAIFAFGGNVSKKIKEPNFDSSKSSIFRPKTANFNGLTKSRYDAAMANRYYEHENRISWEFETKSRVDDVSCISRYPSHSMHKRKPPTYELDVRTPKNYRGDSHIQDDHSDFISSSSSTSSSRATPTSNDQPKMRYRCKLCGQPKQNHKCPYQKSLQRSIGCTVYSAVNAYNATEPGKLAPALSEMNNFVLVTDNVSENTPARPVRGPLTLHPFSRIPRRAVPQVTPEVSRTSLPAKCPHLSPQSRPNVVSDNVAYTKAARYKQNVVKAVNFTPSAPGLNVRRKKVLSPSKAEALRQTSDNDHVFVEATHLRLEQFRSVSTVSHSTFQYTSIPLPYGQRKLLSDNLFELSKEVPSLTDDCAGILRQAREQQMWDLAVAELLSQMIVAIHCPKDDVRLDGLRRYLLSMGISC
uniref:Uncharacterized protein n=1 Tax=Chaetoceros debilis TaxID=122233 RepID=A0A7S3PZU6_9STRA|mmetsp:Transcript_27404/g.40511  ORF Transcript_27404/g.40511 Transcript_27404/m.40511 type:complete len:1234 (+) Transcript_27404:112-3813(+)|eukprot:CAMPEP_0194080558 /NCGR_PEP_ID=MMETSP0149-20130528/6554_1 /TAXON_ID=122233 /ORGANISM="Chaetoceros debilis, Strain MM31A-1" /LENGTH=1233 /DNA_ID=CAMNT_0038762307 /DNA_START=34 /DNA_END=3735 /DNA_ORIENTATION=-